MRADRLRGFKRSELEQLGPQLAHGPVALVEFANTKADQLPAINLAIRIHAPAARVADLIARPVDYPRYMGTLDSVTPIDRQGGAIVYDWEWRMSMLSLDGRNVMRVYRPAKPDSKRGYRITIENTGGDFGTGRFVIRVRPDGPQHSVMVIATRIDLRQANYLARSVAKAARSVNRSANMSLAFAMALSFRREAERRAGTRTKQRPALQVPLLKDATVVPLLDRGDLLVLDMPGEDLRQLWAYGRINRSPKLVRSVMTDAGGFSSALMPGSQATVVQQGKGVTTFDWIIDLPLVGVSGRMEMNQERPEVKVRATRGAFEGGSWRFETKKINRAATMVAAWADFDLKNTNWLLEKLVGADPYLGHGLTAASELMLIRALRTHARKR